MNKKILLCLGTSALAGGVASALSLSSRKSVAALNETVGSFTVVSGSDYVANQTGISTTSGNFVAEQSAITNNYHLQLLAQPDKQNPNGDYGIIFNGSYVGGKLTGDSAKIWYDPGYNDWRVDVGYYEEDSYTSIGSVWCEFYDGAEKTFDFYQTNGEVAFRMNNWYVGTFHLTNVEGNTYVF